MVANQDVNRTQFFFGCRYGLCAARFGAKVGEGIRQAGFSKFLLRAGDAHDAGTARGQKLRGGATDSPAGARDQGNTSFDSRHDRHSVEIKGVKSRITNFNRESERGQVCALGHA